MEDKFYFEPGFSLRSVCAGDEVRLLKQLEEKFSVHVTARDNWVALAGDDSAVQGAIAFFASLSELFKLRQKVLERSDIELLLRGSGRAGTSSVGQLWQGRIPLSASRREVMPRSQRQLTYVNSMREHDVVFGIGPAGTGKTYLAMAMAVSMFLAGEVSRIVLTRPARESGERLGFLPGSLEDKISPYLRPLYDALYEMLSMDEAQDLINRNIIEVAPLAFMRGRTLNKSFIILDEAQNTTQDQMLMFLTRMGFGSRCVVTGDPTQSDLTGNERSGLTHAINTLRHLPEIDFVFFDTSDVVRHSLLEKIINAYNSPETPSPGKEI